MDKINIVFLITDLVTGGAQVMSALLAKNLDKDRYNVKTVCLYGSGAVADMLEQSGIEVISVRMKNRYDILSALKMRRLFKDWRTDVIYTALFDANIWGCVMSKLSGVPVIITTRWSVDVWKKKKHVMAEKLAEKAACGVIINSRAGLDFNIENNYVDMRKAILIRSATDLKRFDPGTSGAPVRKEYGISEDEFVVGSIAQLTAQKGFDYFIRAAAIVNKAVSNVSFFIVGEGRENCALSRLAEELGLKGKVHFTGLRRDIPQVLSAFDVSVLASCEREGLSNTIIESMAMAKPVVATNVGGNSELVQNGITGYLTAPKDAEALASSIITLLKDADLRKKMGSEARKRAEKDFSLDREVEELESVIENFVSQKVKRYA